MTETSSIPEYLAPTGGWPKYTVEALLRLQAAVDRRRAVLRLLHPGDFEAIEQPMSRAIFSLYLDCVQAGAGDDASRILAASDGDDRSIAPVEGASSEHLLLPA